MPVFVIQIASVFVSEVEIIVQEGRASSGGRRKMAAEKKEDSADEK